MNNNLTQAKDSDLSSKNFVKSKYSSQSKSFNTADSVQLYLRQIGRVPLLGREEEVSESQKVQKYNQSIAARNQAAEAGNIILQELIELTAVRDRLTSQISHRPSIKRWSMALDVDIVTLKEKLTVGQQAWADILGCDSQELNKIEQNAVRAKEHMIEANLRLVVSVAKKYQNRGLELLDLIQEGTIGLERAVEKFDPKKGYRFSTYSYWWIRQGITRAIAIQGRTIRLPIHVTEKLNKIKKAQREISQETGRTPNIKDIAGKTNFTEEQVRQALQDIPKSISLDIKVGKEQSTELGDLLEAENESPEENLLRKSLKEDLQKLLFELDAKERIVIKMRFGFGNKRPSSLAEIGKALGVSRERARQIQAKALLKLRQPQYRSMVRDYLSVLND